jgi:hypothetical protein
LTALGLTVLLIKMALLLQKLKINLANQQKIVLYERAIRQKMRKQVCG